MLEATTGLPHFVFYMGVSYFSNHSHLFCFPPTQLIDHEFVAGFAFSRGMSATDSTNSRDMALEPERSHLPSFSRSMSGRVSRSEACGLCLCVLFYTGD